MWIMKIVLLFLCICNIQCQITWISPRDGVEEIVNEDTAINTEIISLDATSNDSSTLTYSIIEQTPADNKFTIRNANRLTLINELNYETTRQFQLRLRALDNTANTEADITVYINVGDINDEPPEFISPPSVTISTETAIDSIVYTAQAQDQDTVGELTYSIKAGNEDNVFVMNATSGDITLTKVLNVTHISEYDLTLEVTDGVVSVQDSVTISITDVIWREPVDKGHYLIQEDQAPDSWSVTLQADNALIYTTISTEVPFSIRNGNEFYLSDSLDFESIQFCTIIIRAIGAMSRTADITVIINITDVNDEPVEFTTGAATLDLSEDTEIGTTVYIPQVTDLDTVGTPFFTIRDGNTNDGFTINSTTGDISLGKPLNPDVTEIYTIVIHVTDGLHNDTLNLTVTINRVVWVVPEKGGSDTVPEGTLAVVTNLSALTAQTYVILDVKPDHGQLYIQGNELTLISALDYENTTSYELILQALDASGKSATISYTVNVADVNDIPPEFKSEASLSLPENTETGYLLYTAEASDEDTVGTLTYSIQGGNTDDTFSIDPTSGVLSLNRSLSPSSNADLSYSLLLQVDDTEHQDTLSLTVAIKTIPLLTIRLNRSISEGVTINSSYPLEVVQLSSSDLDNDPSPTYSLVSQSHTDMFYLNDENNRLMTSTKLDFENIPMCNVTIRVTDTSNFQLSSDGTFILYVINENDEQPFFTPQTPTERYIIDDIDNGSFIFSAEASDPDNFGIMLYSIIDGNTNDDFKIYENGSIAVNNILNASYILTYNLTIQANDTVHTVTTVIQVHLITEPVIALPYPNLTLDEGSYTDYSVWTLMSTDIDNDPDPTYTIISQSVDGTFSLNEDNTQLVTSADIDFETLYNYTVTLSVTDSSSSLRSSTATLTIYINNLNDESPIFTSDTHIELREDTQTGDVVYKALTTDSDSPTTEVYYSIIGGNTNDVFGIDSTSGNLTLSDVLYNYDTLLYSIEIQANDTINFARLVLNVAVVTAPVFKFPDDNITVVENTVTTDGYKVWEFNSTDRDGDINPSYEIISQSDTDTFAVSDDGLKLITTTSFDYETQKEYTVILSVTDNSALSMSSTSTLTIYITDTNDNPPVFTSNDSVEIVEHTNIGSEVYTAVTSDVDTQSIVTYSITDGNINDTFRINETTGVVYLQSPLCPEDILNYVISIQANDTLQTTSFNVTVVVKTAPRFTIPMNVSVLEAQNATSGTHILTLEATDLDGDIGVVYEIVSESVDGTFQINDNNLITIVSFDFETIPEYNITLRATDYSSFSLSSIFVLRVLVQDVNDEQPVFTSNSIVDIPETLTQGSEFYTAAIEDIDTVGTISYAISDGNIDGHFSIGAESGVMILAKAISSNTSLVYNLTIEADDTVQKGFLNLTISILTIPRLQPVIVNIPETSHIVLIWNMTSTDIDGNPNPMYSIVEQSDEGFFFIDETINAVVTNTTFDFETTNLLTFVVQVTDSSSLSLSSSATFTVSVLNENDETPEFTSSMNENVREDTLVDAVVYTTSATDADNLELLTYAIIGGNDDGVFQMNVANGNISLKTALNASDTLIYTLTLQANDTLNVKVMNLTISIRTAPVITSQTNVTVEENIAIDTNILTLSAVDLDGDTNFTFELISQSGPGTFRLDEDNAKLMTNLSIDYELVKNYTIIVSVKDHSQFMMSSESTINVNVFDMNDVKPTFTSPDVIYIAETTNTSAVVYIAKTTDVDTDGTISYSITGGDAVDDFDIDPSNGSVNLKNVQRPVSVNDLTKYLIIQANDSINTETLNLTVRIITVPKIHTVDVYIPEDLVNGSIVWAINSTDLDMDNITFTITKQSETNAFAIYNTSIVSNKDLDYEVTKSYTVLINATDSSELSLSFEELLSIYITDVNDNAPNFTSDSNIYVLQTASTDVLLYTASVEDVDTVGNLTFAVTEGNRNGDFIIEADSGELKLLNNLDPQNTADILYNLLIEANDSINTATLNLTVNIRTVPHINVVNLSLPENTDASASYQIWTINWTDIDGDQSPSFDITSESEDGIFNIVNNSTLETEAIFDYEDIKEYSVNIRITDIHGLTSNVTLTLEITDQNDVSPVFTSNATLALWEETQIGGVIYTAMADDEDTVGQIHYSIADGNSEGKFYIEPINGNITLNGSLDFGTTRAYTLQITVNDSVNTVNFTLGIDIKTSPILNFTGINVEVSEAEPNVTVVFMLTATDLDGDSNPRYDIVSQSVNGTFTIADDKLYTNVFLDYESMKNYTVEIRVTDSSLGLTGTDTLTIFVTDVNDNVPSFTSDTAIKIPETTSVGTVVYKAVAEDPDTVGTLSYSLIDGNSNSDFGIDSSSGNITLANQLDPYATLQYNLTLEVNDTFHSTTHNVTIDLKTEPVMEMTNVTIPELTNTSMNYIVVNLTSTDIDGDIDPSYDIVNQTVLGTFYISDDNTVVLTNAVFNYTDVKLYEVVIRVTDTSMFQLSSTSTLSVLISDINDRPPTFISDTTIYIPETTETGSVIYKAETNDPDTIGEITYSITDGNTDGDFSIESHSGNMTLNTALRPEDVLQYLLELEATDEVNTAAVNLTINVVTIPKFVLPDDNLTIVENTNTSSPYIVLELDSTDLDGDSDHVYTILKQSVNDTFFIVNNTLVTTSTFDFENLKIYDIIIQVTDSSQFVLSSSFTFMVSVLDANDMAPVFTSDTEIYISENTKLNTVVYTAETYDNDTVGPSVIFSIIDGNTNNDFNIDQGSGEMALEHDLRPGTVNNYNLSLQADDTVNQAVLNLIVHVVSEPTLLFPAERITIIENVDKSIDSLIWICNSQDLDGDEDPSYTIVNQTVDGVFELSNDNTTLLTTATFDYEKQTRYEIVISVTDTSPLQLSSTATLTVFIEDVNDELPVFISQNETKIHDTTDIGSVVYTVITEDPDGTVTYKLVDGNTSGDFTIDRESGNLTLVNALNLTTTPIYSLVIEANDTLNSVNFTLTITLVEDIDDCQSDPCKNEAECIDRIDEYTCDCNPGFNGTNCENDIDECLSGPCMNGATCRHGIDEYNCTCAGGYTGDNCEEDINECASNPCLNGGTCDNLIDSFNCACIPGFEGVNCENDTDECESNPCKNNGTCNNLLNKYTCTCKDGFQGGNCEQDIDECADIQCENGATCRDLINAFECVCPLGYTGTLCQQECQSGFYGNNCEEQCTCFTPGTKSCERSNGTCYCSVYYSGVTCDVDVNECERDDMCTSVHEGCDNTVGNYSCDCKLGYTRAENNECVEDTTAVQTTPIPVSKVEVIVDIVFEYNLPGSVDLSVRITYQKYEAELLLKVIFGTDVIRIISITRGSLIVKLAVVTDDGDGGVANILMGLASAAIEIEIFGQSGNVSSLQLNNQSVPVSRQYSDALACEIFEKSYSPCTGDYICDVKDGKPGCHKKDISDIDECADIQCENGATCRDLINAFECVCPLGYTGTLCQQECQSGFYGNNCEEQCTCFTPGTMSCERSNGTCYCSVYYSGVTCDVDVNECERDDTCTGVHEGCDNTVGNYSCDCKLGYTRTENNECVEDTTAVQTTPIPVSKVEVIVDIVFEYNLPGSVDLSVRITYQKYEAELLLKLQVIFGTDVIRIISITRGSLIVKLAVVTDDGDGGVANILMGLASAVIKIEIFGQSGNVSSVQLNNQSVPVSRQYSDALACEIFEKSYSPCTGDYICDVKDGKPGCHKKDTSDNLSIILGLGIGIPGFLICLGLIILCVVYRKVKQRRRSTKHDRSRRRYHDDNVVYYNDSGDYYNVALRANTGPPSWPGLPEYEERMQYNNFTTRESSLRYSYDEDREGPYTNNIVRDDESLARGQFFTHLPHGQPYRIIRPKVERIQF